MTEAGPTRDRIRNPASVTHSCPSQSHPGFPSAQSVPENMSPPLPLHTHTHPGRHSRESLPVREFARQPVHPSTVEGAPLCASHSARCQGHCHGQGRHRCCSSGDWSPLGRESDTNQISTKQDYKHRCCRGSHLTALVSCSAPLQFLAELPGSPCWVHPHHLHPPCSAPGALANLWSRDRGVQYTHLPR